MLYSLRIFACAAVIGFAALISFPRQVVSAPISRKIDASATPLPNRNRAEELKPNIGVPMRVVDTLNFAVVSIANRVCSACQFRTGHRESDVCVQPPSHLPSDDKPSAPQSMPHTLQYAPVLWYFPYALSDRQHTPITAVRCPGSPPSEKAFCTLLT